MLRVTLKQLKGLEIETLQASAIYKFHESGEKAFLQQTDFGGYKIF